CSGEINRQIDNAQDLLAKMKNHYSTDAESIDQSDGLSMSFDGWRFNLRSSNTEPVVRLNVEATSSQLMKDKTKELLAWLV
ncbi:MAG: phosphomannomutase, partial [Porticoccus sp.]